MKPKVSIVIPSLGHVKNIEKLLVSIANQTIDLNNIEVILVVNGKLLLNLKLQLNELSQKFQYKLNIVFLEKKGVNLARNHGLSIASSDLVIFFDDDCFIQDKKYIQKHLDFHKGEPKVFAFGGGYLLASESKFFDSIYNYIQMKWFYSGNLGSNMSGVQLTQFLLGGNFSIKKEMARSNNLSFDESIVYGGSEYDFFRLAYTSQMLMSLTGPDVVHFTNEDFSSITYKLFKQGRGKAHIDTKYGSVTELQATHYKESFSIFENLFMLYFNYVFWAGYYSNTNSLFGFFAHLIKDFISFINTTRFNLLNKVTKKIISKKSDGDRF
jgi:glycosyltransferase involved in cell wall biosynthesis